MSTTIENFIKSIRPGQLYEYIENKNGWFFESYPVFSKEHISLNTGDIIMAIRPLEPKENPAPYKPCYLFLSGKELLIVEEEDYKYLKLL